VIRQHSNAEGVQGARFSECRRYRYELWRRWPAGTGTLIMVMLNPSTADHENNDPTVERCQRRATRLGFGGLIVLNIFALRSTDPRALYAEPDPIGDENDRAIECALMRFRTGMVVCAWGGHGKHRGRGEAVRSMIQACGREAHVFRLNEDGTPAHPLYLPYSLTPRPWLE
jgi:hypothetical protein